MTRRFAALALAVLVTAGCDTDDEGAAPAEGSCQALVDEVIEIDECNLPLGKVNDLDPSPDESAACAAEVFSLPEPPSATIEGEAYEVAYAALCELHGNTAAGFCDISETLGCGA